MDDLYNCFSCDAINRATKNRRCTCVGSESSLVCEKCGRCFCTAPTIWKNRFNEKFNEVLRRADQVIDHERPIVLIVDDDRVIHALASRVLADFPGTVLHAYNGQEGLLMAQDVRPDVVITDCLMPLLDGREIARALKTDPQTRHIKIVAMTSLYRGARYRHEAYNSYQVDEFVEKPITAAKLREIALAAVTGPLADGEKQPVVWR